MTPSFPSPDLSQIGESAFREVLGTLLSLPTVFGDSTGHTPSSDVPDPIRASVPFNDQRLSGSVQLLLPKAFISQAVRLLTGLDEPTAQTNGLLEDTAGELANMVAGRVAAKLRTDGCSCTLGTPLVSSGAGPILETEPGFEHGRAELICEGHRLALEIQCRYADP